MEDTTNVEYNRIILLSLLMIDPLFHFAMIGSNIFIEDFKMLSVINVFLVTITLVFILIIAYNYHQLGHLNFMMVISFQLICVMAVLMIIFDLCYYVNPNIIHKDIIIFFPIMSYIYSILSLLTEAYIYLNND